MSSFVFLIEQIAPGIYILCGLGALWGARMFFSAQRALFAAHFELERELALERRAKAINRLGAAILIALGVYAISHVVAPVLREAAQSPSSRLFRERETLFVTSLPVATETSAANAGPLNTPAPAILPAIPDGNATAVPVGFATAPAIGSGNETVQGPTPTFTFTPIGTILADVDSAVGCDNPNVTLTRPANGQVLSGTTEVTGAANAPGLVAYKLELNGPATDDTWSTLRTYYTAVQMGALGQLNTDLFEPGYYNFRLNVVDGNDTTIAMCTITVIFRGALPTFTPGA